jgi:hypothetical protein
MSVNAMLPTVCRCGALAGIIADDSVICSSCGAERTSLSPVTQQFLAGIAKHFGDPVEPVVFRRPDAAEQIEQQDLYLKTHHVRDGRSFHQVITDVFDRIEDGGETPNDSGEETVDGPTIGEQDSADSQ